MDAQQGKRTSSVDTGVPTEGYNVTPEADKAAEDRGASVQEIARATQEQGEGLGLGGMMRRSIITNRGVSVQAIVRATRADEKGPARAIKRHKNKAAKMAGEAAEEVGVGRTGVGRRRQVEGGPEVLRAYKKVGKKVRPANVCGDGLAVDGDPDWKKKRVEAEKRAGKHVPRGPYDHILIPKFSDKPRGFRLTHQRLLAMDIGDTLTPRERELLVEMLYNRESALAFDMTEIGLFSSDIEPPHVIRTLPHQPWQEAPFKTPRALENEVIEIIKVRLEVGIVERARSPYRNPWFLVRKKAAGHRLVNSFTKGNGYTILDAALPPRVDEFSEEFAGMAIASIVDLLSGYDQVELAEESRDMTAFQTPLGLMRMTRLVQGGTNSVQAFQRINSKTQHDNIPHRCRVFLDDVGIKGPISRYNDEEAYPGIRRFVMEHISNLDHVLADYERAGATVAGLKSSWCKPGIKIVGFVCTEEGRFPDAQKVEKLVQWPACSTLTEVRAFLGVATYYRIWVREFSVVAAPLFDLQRKNVEFVWGPEQEQAMETIKHALTTAPALATPRFGPDVGALILAVDAGGEGWGAVLMQEDAEGRRHPCRYESGLWSPAEKLYDAGKKECKGLLKALKKMRFWLYGVRFVVEIDAKTLVHQLNLPANDLPGALVTRWIAWIRLFDFDVRHIPGKQHTAADGLSRRKGTAEEIAHAAIEDPDELEQFLDDNLFIRRLEARPVTVRLVAGEYTGHWADIGRFLEDMELPADLTPRQREAFRKEATRFLIRDGHLFKRGRENQPPKRVVCKGADQQRVIRELHDESGHRGRVGTQKKISQRFWWQGLSKQVEDYVRSCEQCQLRATARYPDELHPTFGTSLFEKVCVDIVHMPKGTDQKRYLVLARDDFSGWVEGRALSKGTSERVADFLFQEVISRFGCPKKIVVDGGPENKDFTKRLLERYGIDRKVVSAYHPQANGLVERGHQPVVDALQKISETPKDWPGHLHAVLWADRVTTRRSTARTPFDLVFGWHCVLPVDISVRSWGGIEWSEVYTTEELLAARARQLEARNEDLLEAAADLRDSRTANKTYFDAHRRQRPGNQALRVGELALLHNTQLDKQWSNKLANRWRGPYRIVAISPVGSISLAELDGTPLQGTAPPDRVKKFFERWKEVGEPGEAVEEAVAEEEEEEEQSVVDGKRVKPRKEWSFYVQAPSN